MSDEGVPIILSRGNYELATCCVCGFRFYTPRTERPIGCSRCYVKANPFDFSEPRESLFVFDSISDNGVMEWKTAGPAETVFNGCGLELDTETESNNE